MCSLELPDIEASLWQVYRDRGVIVVGIHSGENAAQLAAFVEQTGVTFPIVQDEGTRAQLAFPPGVGFPYPRDVVIGPDMTIRSIRNSYNVAEMDALIAGLIAERDRAP